MSYLKNNKADFITLPTPDNSTSFFQAIKHLSEWYWTTTQPNKNAGGFQIQENTKWKPGLSDTELLKFQDDMGFSFPEPLKNFYKVMNGLNKPGINMFGSDGTQAIFRSIFYSYPDDINMVKESIKWIYQANSISENDLLLLDISKIFPICGHRFMLIDTPGNPILSIYGDDIMYWADDLCNLIANELFENIHNAHDYESLKYPKINIKFWLHEK